MTVGAGTEVTLRGLGGLPRDRDLLRAVHRRAEHNAGVYAAVEEPGVLRPGDRVELLP
ncbi:hypothetical protein [Actinomadura napierensis]|uniref:MOSC domain-containing protein n=1 Tax=Actinomadura napierensis TaxID=267854 RepID=A0ABN3AGQ5_9ACTN